MKKLLVIFCLVFIADYCFAQLDTSYPSPPQQLGRKNVLVVDSGGLKSAQMFVAPIYGDTTTANTANPYTRSYVGSVIYTQDKQAYWFRQDVPRKWVLMGSSSGNNNTDTIFTEIPIAVKIDSLGRHIIYFLRPNGLYGGGIVTVDSCMTIDVTPPTIVVNYVQYTGLQTIGVTIQPADPSLPRIDRVVMDTSLQIIVIEGMPSSTPVPPEFNSFSQVSLAEIPVGAAITCLGNAEIIFDGVADFAGQWTISTSGTGVTSFTNTVNPYHLTQASYTVTYSSGYQIIYTKPTGTDTVKATSVLKGFVVVVGTYPNTNQISGQWFNGSTAVSNQLLLNSYFNVNDSNNYQIFSPQLSAWSWPGGTVYNKLVLTFGGNDNSGSNGVYLDWLQIQTGIGNAANKQYQDSSSIVAGFLTDWYNGVPITRQAVGGGGAVTADNGLSISSGSNVQLGGVLLQNTTIDLNGNSLILNNLDSIGNPYNVLVIYKDTLKKAPIARTLNEVAHNGNGTDTVLVSSEGFYTFPDAGAGGQVGITDLNNFSSIALNSNPAGRVSIFFTPVGRATGTIYADSLSVDLQRSWELPDSNGVIVLSVNGNFADIHGNVTIGGGGGNTIYTGNGTYAASANRVIDQNAGTTTFNNGFFGIGGTPVHLFDVNDGVGNSYFYVDTDDIISTSGDGTAIATKEIKANVAENSHIYFNVSDGIGSGSFQIHSDSDDGYDFNLSVGDGVNNVGVAGNAADKTLQFTGTVIMATQYTPTSSTDTTYPPFTLTQDDTNLYYEKADGTWVKIPWQVF